MKAPPKINTELYKQPNTSCPLCNSSFIPDKYTITRYQSPFTIAECLQCGFQFMNPCFTQEIIESFYREDYYQGSAEYSYHDEREAEKYFSYVWNKRLKVIRSYVSSGNFLDVGCAFGGFLKAAAPWFTPYGIEISKYAASHAVQAFGNNIHNGSLENNPFEEKFFSVITMIEVLEHLTDPHKVLSDCYRLLEDSGLLVLQTANLAGLQARIQGDRYAYYMPGHLSYFTQKNLSDILRDTGFKEIRVYHPVEFGLLPKLKKSRMNFRSIKDYRKWFRIAWYHYLSKLSFGNLATTSSMVIYAVK